jgi:hypothetical protein
VTRSDKISLGISLLAALIIVPAALGVLGVGIASGSGGGSGASRVVSALDLLLGIGILMRREIARAIFVVFGVIGAALILLGSVNASGGEVLLALVIQLVPVVFLMLGSVRSRFG